MVAATLAPTTSLIRRSSRPEPVISATSQGRARMRAASVSETVSRRSRGFGAPASWRASATTAPPQKTAITSARSSVSALSDTSSPQVRPRLTTAAAAPGSRVSTSTTPTAWADR